MNVGMLISSLAAPVCIQVPAFLSSNWFPTNERTTATAIGVMSSIAGTAAGFVVGPTFVPYSAAQMYNRSVINDSVVRLGQLRSQFKELMYFQVFSFDNQSNLRGHCYVQYIFKVNIIIQQCLITRVLSNVQYV